MLVKGTVSRVSLPGFKSPFFLPSHKTICFVISKLKYPYLYNGDPNKVVVKFKEDKTYSVLSIGSGTQKA